MLDAKKNIKGDRNQRGSRGGLSALVMAGDSRGGGTKRTMGKGVKRENSKTS